MAGARMVQRAPQSRSRRPNARRSGDAATVAHPVGLVSTLQVTESRSSTTRLTSDTPTSMVNVLGAGSEPLVGNAANGAGPATGARPVHPANARTAAVAAPTT